MRKRPCYKAKRTYNNVTINPLNAKLNPVCHLLALLGARPILHVSRIRVKAENLKQCKCVTANLSNVTRHTTDQVPRRTRDVLFFCNWPETTEELIQICLHILVLESPTYQTKLRLVTKTLKDQAYTNLSDEQTLNTSLFTHFENGHHFAFQNAKQRDTRNNNLTSS
jgi:hypothetical protein